MKYRITIEGGFTGIPKSFEGELNPDGNEAGQLLAALESAEGTPREQWPDALHYHVILIEGMSRREEHFTEVNLPPTIREFIDSLRNNGGKAG